MPGAAKVMDEKKLDYEGMGGYREVDLLGVKTIKAEDYDNWRHRSKNMRCGTGMWFKEKMTDAVQRNDHVIGRCRRHAPTMAGFPVVWSDDWCGDHKLDETKIPTGAGG